jgi:hypothetical protein|tara:strand:+ start:239 stop:712 length:474 start_codon:yes stop_codon:yes gene_type:complete
MQPNFMPLIITLCLLLVTQTAGAAALGEEFPGVEALMSQDEQDQTGVSELSTAQVRALNDWLIRYTAEDAPKLIDNNPEVQRVRDEPIRSRIIGSFQGWRGKTRVTLENGQVWQQRLANKWYIKLENPEVEIRKTFFGYYEMTFIAHGRTMGVARVE